MGKKTKLTLLCFLMGSCLLTLISACRKENTRTYTIINPIYKTKAEVLAAINGNPAQPIESAGKIFIKDNYIFINESDKGVHLIDNTKPAHPVQIAFLNIPGNQNMVIKENILYADMYSDLLSIDITDPAKGTVRSLLPGIFKSRMFYRYVNGLYTQSDLILTGWTKKDTTVIVSETPIYSDYLASSYNSVMPQSSNNKTGTSGSMAGMVMVNDYLYALAGSDSLSIINTRDPAIPNFVSNWYAGSELQTIYPFENKLFLGSARGMFMYDINDPENPVSLGQFSHVRSCDPVVTDGQYAYVTLHTGTRCAGSLNQLDVVNVRNLQFPQLVKSYPLTRPTGLCKDGNLLFICDGPSGVKLYDASVAADLKFLQLIKSDEPYDIIARDHLAIIVTGKGLYQYDYNDIHKIRLLSFFSTQVTR